MERGFFKNFGNVFCLWRIIDEYVWFSPKILKRSCHVKE